MICIPVLLITNGVIFGKLMVIFSFLICEVRIIIPKNIVTVANY